VSTRRVELAKSPDAAWESLKRAASDVGKVKEESEAARFLVVKARYGLNAVKLRVSVLSGAAPESAVLDIQGRGQDIAGVASRKVIDRLIAALR